MFQTIKKTLLYLISKYLNIQFKGDYNMTPDRHLGAAWIGTVNFTRYKNFNLTIKYSLSISLFKTSVDPTF